MPLAVPCGVALVEYQYSLACHAMPVTCLWHVYAPKFVLVGCNYADGAYQIKHGAEQIKHGCFLRQVGITDFGLS